MTSVSVKRMGSIVFGWGADKNFAAATPDAQEIEDDYGLTPEEVYAQVAQRCAGSPRLTLNECRQRMHDLGVNAMGRISQRGPALE